LFLKKLTILRNQWNRHEDIHHVKSKPSYSEIKYLKASLMGFIAAINKTYYAHQNFLGSHIKITYNIILEEAL
jgi:hypothetical protein